MTTDIRIEQTNLSSVSSFTTSGGDIEIGTLVGGLYKQILNKAPNALMRLGSSSAFFDPTDTACTGYFGIGLNSFSDTQDISNYGIMTLAPLSLSFASWKNGYPYNLFSANLGYIIGATKYGFPAFTMDHQTGSLTVKQPTLVSLTVDQTFALEDSSDASDPAWQSFTAGFNGLLDGVEFKNVSGVLSTGNTVRIYRGVGLSGALLAEETGISAADGVITQVLFTDRFYLTNGSPYTISISGGANFAWAINSAGGYAGGSYMGTAADAVFTTLMTPEQTFSVNVSGTSHTNFISTVATGTAPFSCTSTTECTNLNAAKCNGYNFDQSLLIAASPTFADLTLNDVAANEVALTISSAGTAKWKFYRPASSTDLRIYDTNNSRDTFSFVTGGAISRTGTDSNMAGPHTTIYTSASATYPVFQQVNYSQDRIELLFDAYFDSGAWKSSDTGTNFYLGKISDTFHLKYNTGTAQGSNITWSDGISLNTSGYVGVNVASGTVPLDVYGTQTGANWAGRGYFGGATAGIVLGQFNNIATIGGHNRALAAWTNVVTNGYWGFGNLSPSTTIHAGVSSTAPSGELGSLCLQVSGTTYRLAMGYNSASEYAWIQSVYNGWYVTSLYLNPQGGKIYAPNIYSNNVGAVRQVYVDSAGQLGYNASTRALKNVLEEEPDISWLYNIPIYKVTYKNNPESGVWWSPLADDCEEIVDGELCLYHTEGETEVLDGFAYAKMDGVYIKALKDHQAKLEALEARIEALENP